MNLDYNKASSYLTLAGTLLTGLSFMEVVNGLLAIAVLLLGGYASLRSIRKDKKAEQLYEEQTKYYKSKNEQKNQTTDEK